MKVFIFGAGASKGSQADQFSPISPLIDELFSESYQDDFASPLGLHLSDMKDYRSEIEETGEGVEGWLTKKWDAVEGLRTSSSKSGQWREFSRITYYVWWLMTRVSSTYDGGNGYKKLVQKIRAEDKTFGMINFNYDTLLDQALQEVMNFNLDSNISSYSDNNYLKPHGSVNWFLMRRNTDPTIGSNSPIRIDLNAQLDIAYRMLFNPDPIPLNYEVIPPAHHISSPSFIAGQHFGYDYAYPLVMIPLATKLYTRAKGFYDNVVLAGREIISKTDEIYIIGYSAGDKILDDFLKNTKPSTKIHIISFGSGEEIMTRVLQKNKNLIRGQVNNGGFMNFVGSYF